MRWKHWGVGERTQWSYVAVEILVGGLDPPCAVEWCAFRGRFRVGITEKIICGRHLPMIVEAIADGQRRARELRLRQETEKGGTT